MPSHPPATASHVNETVARIMIVDDTPENLTLLKNMLDDQGFDIYALPSGALAMRAAQRVPPDLVLLDITMPEMDGYEVCKQFKQDARLQDIPIIFLSALTATHDKVLGFKAGAVDFITKPFQFEEVHARVNTHLELRRLQQRLAFQNQHLQELVDEQVQLLAQAHAESRQRLNEVAHLNRNITSSVYSAAIAHDLRQPLAAILANAEAAELLLAKDPPDLREVKEILGDIRRDDQRADLIIQRMRKLLNKGDSEAQAHDLSEIVLDVVNFMGSEAKIRQVQMHAQVAPKPLRVMGDRVHLQQVLINLVLNSMDAMATIAPAQRTLSVCSSMVEEKFAKVVVTDTGTGFAGNVEHAFESFFTTKPTGMGMGLSITAALVHAHQGDIVAANGPTSGAVVYFQLPLLQPFKE